MLKTISALAIATASFTAPALSQDVAAPVAPVADLNAKGLAGAGAYIVGGITIVGIAAVAIGLGSDDNDGSGDATGGTSVVTTSGT